MASEKEAYYNSGSGPGTPAPMRLETLSADRVGVMVRCSVCGDVKKPIGRSGPLGASYCDDDCGGYRLQPYPGSLWWGESEADFGYPVGVHGTTDAPPVPVQEGEHDPNE